jgi:hypothetical protein
VKGSHIGHTLRLVNLPYYLVMSISILGSIFHTLKLLHFEISHKGIIHCQKGILTQTSCWGCYFIKKEKKYSTASKNAIDFTLMWIFLFSIRKVY